MMFQKCFSIVLLLAIALQASAQLPAHQSKRASLRQQSKIASEQQIKELHNGALLVRLRTRSNSINALRKAGKDWAADKIAERQALRNYEIVQAFRNHFDFCPVYFFFSSDSRSVAEQQFGEVHFLNDTLGHDPSISFDGGAYLTAEFANIEQDTMQRFSHYSTSTADNRSARYYGGPNFGFGALIIKSKQFAQLRDPFPYYVRTYDSLPIKRSVDTVVKVMNQKLHRYHH